MIEAVRNLASILAGVFKATAVPELDDSRLLPGGAAGSFDNEQEPPDPEPLTIDNTGLLQGAKVVHILTKRGGYRWRTKSGRPGGFLTHWTATSHGTARSMVKRTQTGTGGSVHLWIEHDGTIFQQVPFTRGAGHAGGPTSMKLRDRDGAVIADSKNGRYSANSFLIGCEVVNVGEVREVGGKWMGWPYGRDGKKGPIVPADQVFEAMDTQGRRKHYQTFTVQQLEAIERVIAAGVAEYGWSRSACSWGHCDMDPTRKSDPGPHFRMVQLPAILDRVFGDADSKAA